ncbi:uncharacterized protein LOC112905968 [Agrilus planipennis]|uniref:Uncharacterized protein LOC112905968 n=1 Tax=Agrilus planipennis TaxID=224129 RepID=A0A7F5RH79_AGRPL|nr:uncharacterized protein LOC112905968 [Agrilus planipennis]
MSLITNGKPLEKSEEKRWQSSDTINIPPRLKNLLRQLFSSNIDEERDEEDSSERVGTQEKRGFSIFARMRPFNSVVKQRTSIRHPGRSILPFESISSADVVSAEKHNFRPVGQPLRWG